MNIVVDFLENSQVQYFATVGIDGKPKVRPFQFMYEENGKLYFCTSNNKEVYKEMKKQPYIELCASGENFSWIRIEGKVIFTDSLDVKAKVLDVSPLVKSIYQSPDNPAFEVFYLAEAKATISDFSGNPPQKFML